MPIIYHQPGDRSRTIRTVLNNNAAFLADHLTQVGNPHSTLLSDLTDVTITTPTEGQALLYDAGISAWVNNTIAAGTDTTIAVTGETPLDGDVELIPGTGVTLSQVDLDKTITIGLDADVLLNAEKLWGKDLEEPGAGDGGKTYVYNESTDDFDLQAYGASPRADVYHPIFPNTVWVDTVGAIVDYDEILDLSVGYDGTGGATYFHFATTSGTTVSVYAIIKFNVPLNFVEWKTSEAVKVRLRTTDGSGASYMDIACYQNGTAVGTKTTQTASGGWAYITLTEAELGGSLWAGGDVLTLQVKLAGITTKTIDLGDVQFLYTA